MRKILLALMGLMMMAGVCEGATVYAKGITGTVYYESGAASCDAVTAADTAGDLEAALAASGASGTLNICAGTYTTTMIDAADGLDATAAAQMINGIGTVIIDGSDIADGVFQTGTIDDGTINNVQFVANAGTTRLIYVLDGATGWVFNGCVFSGPKQIIVTSVASVTTTFNYCKFKGLYKADSVYGITIEGGATAVFNYCVFTPHGNLFAGRIRAHNTSVVNLYNNVFVGCSSSCIYTGAATASVTAKNNVFVGSNVSGDADHTIIDDDAGGTIVVANNLWLPYGESPNLSADLGVSADANDVNSSPRFTATGYNKGYVVLSVDDGSSTGFAYAQAIAIKADGLGVKFTWFVDQAQLAANEGYAAVLQDLNSRGHEIGLHSYSHSNMTLDNVFTVLKAGQTIDVDRATDTITVSGVAAYTPYKTKTLAEIRTWLSGTAGVTLGTTTSSLETTALGEIIADTSGAQSINGAYMITIDKTADASQGYYKAEIVDPKAWIESTVGGGYTVKTAAAPGNNTDATYRGALKAAGILGARGATSGSKSMTSMDVFNVRTYGVGHAIFGDNTAAVLTRNGAALASFALATGGIHVLLTHNATEYTTDQIGSFITGVLSVPGIEVVTLGTAISHIRDSGNWATSDNVTFTRTFTDNSDYSLLSSSPAINAGVSIPGLHPGTDYAGNKVPFLNGKVDIGSMEYQAGDPWAIGGGGKFLTFPRFPSFPSR